MTNENDRYYQPTDIKDALQTIQKLFNSYTDAPLTPELMAYHQKLSQQLQTNLLPLAKQQKNQLRVDQINSMVTVMQDWLKLRLNGQVFNGKMQHFKFVSNSKTTFKRRVHKIKGSQNHRSSRH
ncbi:hypothetical protein [Lactiplantibacillus mudanjiangensis]|uniref:Uncharacterized protein n=1 Tax=Lactiplantibacillus mudanjiangensis TaxID=1296538 RepID=A0A660DVR6_9LACO|nr:hypothetical protein [Lactiplantibacillus mudanjiangensis]VDG21298.1 hypothetical protein MUDAN_BIHEEGNE_02930 [Lactiplantibacillus mudanjiangensis]VDG22430.1 hypothetical protein MUDAN_IGPPGNFN_00005 [Lactiplantibacillus mudanjiangensis]VDG27034.1 hypothetical protein MUDAN_MDHGFNIF_00402 [Lactiplantibacillus mudanjiangensis]VDG32131.1 hypothetical protein MUDAN_DOGOELCO_01423 [Lactiplantibacillus mudanjiangensis]